MTDRNLYPYDGGKVGDDTEAVENVYMKLWNADRVAAYLETLRRADPAFADMPDGEILERTHVLADGKPTIAGLFVFHGFPQASFPGLCVAATALPGTEMAEEGPDGERFLDTERISGPVSDMLDSAMGFVRRNMRTKTVINDQGRRVDIPEYPVNAVREAVMNALIHRDYGMYSQNAYISIEMYRDRMEISNRGEMCGGTILEDGFIMRDGTPHIRNVALVGILETLGLVKNRFSGIRAICDEFDEAGFPAPVFISGSRQFTVVFKNKHYLPAAEEKAVPGCYAPQSRRGASELV